MRLIIDLNDPPEKGDQARDVAMEALRAAELNPYRAKALQPGEVVAEEFTLDPPQGIRPLGIDLPYLSSMADIDIPEYVGQEILIHDDPVRWTVASAERHLPHPPPVLPVIRLICEGTIAIGGTWTTSGPADDFTVGGDQ